MTRDGSAAAPIDYAVDVDVAAATAQMRIEFEPGRTLDVRARKGRASDLLDRTDCDGRARERPPPETRRLRLSGGCEVLRVRLRPVAGRGERNVPPDVLFASPAQFLWLPDLGAESVLITLSARASVPWPREDARRSRIPASPHSSDSLIVFGAFNALTVEGLHQPAAFIGPVEHADKIRRWLHGNVAAVGAAAGGALNPDAQLIVLDVGRRGPSPVPFGRVIRDQGETVMLYVDAGRSLADLDYDWTAAHELSHLLLPYVNERWISEGFASYYQNVIQARRGAYSEAEAWRRLAGSFRRAAAESRGLAPAATEEADFWRARMMIYWSGAALALLADVELRERHATSLDAVLANLARCCLPAHRAWSAAELMRRIDRSIEATVMSDLYDRIAAVPGMPPTAAVFERLGVVASSDGAALSDTAPSAHVRQAIMKPRRPPTAASP